MIYTVQVEKKTIKITGDTELVRGNVEIDYLDATFDADWADMERIYCIFYDGKPEGTRMKMEDGRCEIPWERLEDTDTIKLTFIGYDDDDEDADRRIVTREMVNAFAVKEHGWLDGDDPAEPTPTAWAVMEQRIEELEANGGGGASLPDGGTEGQMLTLDAEGNAAWGDVPQPDLSGYVTESELESKGYITEHQDVSGKIDKSGGDMEGTIVASYSKDGGQVRNVFIMTSEPNSSVGKDGDIALVIGG